MNDPQVSIDKAYFEEALRAGQEGADALVRLELATNFSPQTARDAVSVLRLLIDAVTQAIAGAEHVREILDRIAKADGR